MATERISFQDGSITLSLSIDRESRDHMLRVHCGGTTATLNAQDALTLLQWLYEHRDTLLTHGNATATGDVEQEYKCVYPGCSHWIPSDLFIANSGYCDEHQAEREEGRHSRNVS